MKVILTGAIGFVGQKILTLLLSNPSITTVLALTRRDLSITHPKLRVLITKDFLSYPDNVTSELKDVDACIWSLGLIPRNLTTMEEARKVSIDYTCKAIDVMLPETKNLRFVYISGFMTERDQEKPLWIMEDYRRIRGQMETELLNYADSNKNFKPCIIRPAGVLASPPGWVDWVKSFLPITVGVDALAAACVKAAVEGTDKTFVQNAEIPGF